MVIIKQSNKVTAPSVLKVSRPNRPNHVLHLILTVLTCGIWAPIWLLITVVNAATSRPRQPGVRGFVAEHPALCVGGALLGISAVVSAWKVLLALAILLAIVAVPAGLGVLIWRERGRSRQRKAEIAARADLQHNALMAGQTDIGTYGQFQPAPIDSTAFPDAEQMRQQAWKGYR